MSDFKNKSVGAVGRRKLLSLNGDWILEEAGAGRSYPATVPGSVHTDLIDAGTIPDPFFSTNELDLQWISEKDWIYRRSFEIDSSFAPDGKIALVCEGLDTVATVRLNGKIVGTAENMFRNYDFDVTDVLVPGTNTVEVKFFSPSRKGRKKSLEIPYEIAGSEYHWPLGQDTITYRNQLRKAQYQFGWDWAPCLPTLGIWKDIYLISYGRAILDHVVTRQKFDGSDVNLEIISHVRSLATGSFSIKAVLERSAVEDGKSAADTSSKEIKLSPGMRICPLDMRVGSPDLWHPNGYGGQTLYTLKVMLMDGDKILDIKLFRIGFRKIELVRKPDRKGESFFFRVNGVPVFAKGANWVPADSFPSRITSEKYEFILQSAADANMNMLRVWGGGIYESDIFYDLCDEKGIMVWQDFLFACCAYPATPEFLKNVREEVRCQVRRLGNHASLALWCGNNENEGVWKWWGRNREHAALVKNDYRRLQKMLAKTCGEEDDSRPFHPASPFPEGKENIGDEHVWHVGSRREPFSDYLKVKPRFVSEFGFQSFPSVHTVGSMVSKEDLNISTPAIEHHQRKKGWNPLLMDYICMNFRFPSSIEQICYLSQLNQALAMKTAVEHWRRSKPWTMGTLYWQYNDCWPAVSWAGIDYNLNWKALQYFARHFYAPLLVSFLEKDDSVDIWLTSDYSKPVAGSIIIQIWRTDGELLDSLEEPFRLRSQQNIKMTSLTFKRILKYGNKKDNTVLHAKIVGADSSACNTHVLVPYKYLDLRQPDIEYSSDSKKNEIVLSAKKPAFFVKLDSPGGTVAFKDNYFNLFPDSHLSLPHGKFSAGRDMPFTHKLELTSLADVHCSSSENESID